MERGGWERTNPGENPAMRLVNRFAHRVVMENPDGTEVTRKGRKAFVESFEPDCGIHIVISEVSRLGSNFGAAQSAMDELLHSRPFSFGTRMHASFQGIQGAEKIIAAVKEIERLKNVRFKPEVRLSKSGHANQGSIEIRLTPNHVEKTRLLGLLGRSRMDESDAQEALRTLALRMGARPQGPDGH